MMPVMSATMPAAFPVMRMGSDAYALHVTTYRRGIAQSIVIYRLGMSWPVSWPMIRTNPADETLPYMFVADETTLQLVARTLAMEIQLDLGVEDFFADEESITGDTSEGAGAGAEEDKASEPLVDAADESSDATDESSDAADEGSDESMDDGMEGLKIVFRLAKILPDRNWADYLDGLQDSAAWMFLWQYAAAVNDGSCLREMQTATVDGVRLILGGYQNLSIWSCDG